MAEFSNVFQPTFEELKTGFSIKGKWKSDIFKNNYPLVLELGCGKGEYSVGLARKYPNKNFLGIDVKGSRMWKGASDALNERMSNVAFLRTRIEFIEYCFIGKSMKLDYFFQTLKSKEKSKK